RSLPGEMVHHSPPDGPEQGRETQDQMRQAWARAAAFRVVCVAQLVSEGAQKSAWLSISPRAVAPGEEHSVSACNLWIDTRPVAVEPAPAPEIAPDAAARDPVLSARKRLGWRFHGVDPHAWWAGWLSKLLPPLAASYDLNLVADGYLIQRG